MKPARIRHFPDPVLRKKTLPIRVFGGALKHLISTMIATMKREPHGIGISAPQIGISKAVAIVDVSARVPKAKRLILINPVILEKKNPIGRKEGCMSLPDYTGYLKRYEWIRLRCQDERGVSHEKISTGIEAICIQHEVDHLEGKLFIDHVACLKTDLFPRHFKKFCR